MKPIDTRTYRPKIYTKEGDEVKKLWLAGESYQRLAVQIYDDDTITRSIADLVCQGKEVYLGEEIVWYTGGFTPAHRRTMNGPFSFVGNFVRCDSNCAGINFVGQKPLSKLHSTRYQHINTYGVLSYPTIIKIIEWYLLKYYY